MSQQKRVPIERLNKFFSAEDFELEIGFGREWLEGDINIKHCQNNRASAMSRSNNE